MKKTYLYFIVVLSGLHPVCAQMSSQGGGLNSPYRGFQLSATNVFGTIYNKSTWTNTADFITNGNSTAALSGNYVNISSATVYDWANTIYITNYQTKLENWQFKARFKIINWAANSYGIGFGLKSANTVVQNDVLGFLQTTNSGVGTLYIVKSDQSVLSTGAVPLGVALNDVIDVTALFDDSIFTFTANNLTFGSTASVSYSYATNGSTPVVPNSGFFSLLELGGTHQIQNIEITSNEATGANIVTIGDSKTIGYFANTFAGRYAAQLNNSYPVAIINAGGGDRVTHALARQTELERLAPTKYLLCIGSNDLRFGGTLAELQTNYNTLVGILQATGAGIYHILIPEDYTKPGTVNQIAFKNWVAATYGSGYINGVWDSLSNSDLLKGIYDSGDGIHLNQAANDKIYEALVASGKFSTTLPVKLYSFEVKKINSRKALLSWKVDPLEQASVYTVLKSNDGSNFSPLAEIVSNVSAVYSYTDGHLSGGTAYYKLKMTEADGKFTYSRIVAILNKKEPLEVVSLLNYNGNELALLLDASAGLRAGWEMTDAAGRQVAKNNLQLTTGRNAITIPVSHLSKGVYYLKIFSASNDPVTTIPFAK